MNLTPMGNSDLLIGKTVAEKYQIIELIGSGGQGSVYKAKHLRLNRTVALKVLRSDFIEDAKISSRFHQEAQIAGQLEHLNIVRAIDHGRCKETGVDWIEMDYVNGVPLKNLLQPAKESPNSAVKPEVGRVLNILIQLCDGISHAHKKRGVLHRDIKPSNVLLTNVDDRSDVVKITDFGIAKVLIESDELKRLTKTEMGNPEGTCLYMAPEQFKEGYKPDFLLDVYSIGCILFELLTGKPPFKGTSDIATINMHINAEIPDLELDSVDPVIRSRLANIVTKALAKDPSARYQSVDELRVDLEKTHALLKQLNSNKISAVTLIGERLWLFLINLSRKVQRDFLSRKISSSGTTVGAIVAMIFFLFIIAAAAAFLFLVSIPSDAAIVDRELPLKPTINTAIKAPDQKTYDALWRKLQEARTHQPEILEHSLKAFMTWADANKISGNYLVASGLYAKAEQIADWLKLSDSVLFADILNSHAENQLFTNLALGSKSQAKNEQLVLKEKGFNLFVKSSTLHNMGLSMSASAAEARDYSLGTLTVMKNLDKDISMQCVVAYALLAESALELNVIKGAMATFDTFRNLSLRTSLLNESDKSRATMLLAWAGQAYLRQHRLAEAQTMLLSSQIQCSEIGQLGKYNMAVICNDLGLIQELNGENRQAEALFRQAYSSLISSGIDDHKCKFLILNNIAGSAYRANDYITAVKSKLAALTNAPIQI